jgi:hypothetical protein
LKRDKIAIQEKLQDISDALCGKDVVDAARYVREQPECVQDDFIQQITASYEEMARMAVAHALTDKICTIEDVDRWMQTNDISEIGAMLSAAIISAREGQQCTVVVGADSKLLLLNGEAVERFNVVIRCGKRGDDFEMREV